MNKAIIAAVFPLCSLYISVAHSAQYELVELPVSDLGKNTFPAAINDVGQVAVNLDTQYSPVIDTTLIDFDSAIILLGLENVDGVRGGDFSDFDYTFLYSYITANAEALTFQQIGSLNSYISTENGSELLRVFDTIDPNTDDYRNSVKTQARSINNFGYVVGNSHDGFYTETYVNDDVEETTYVVNDFYQRGFAQVDDQITELLPPDITAGGLSDAYDINNSNQVVGFGTTEFVSDAFATAEENCADPIERGDVPESVCLRTLNISLSGNIGSAAQLRGIIWQLDEDGDLIDTYTLGMLIDEPDDSSSTVYASTAVAINDFGTAVGQSPSYYQDTTSLTTAAAIYIGDEVSTINYDEDVFSSTAHDINNDNLVVGNVTKLINGDQRTKFFIHDLENDLTIYPDDFFEGSASVATSINNEGYVVGYGESEAVLTTRRTEGFIYDYKNDIFQGLNSLLECNSDYDIVQANGINDDNEIVATALISKPQRNIQGEIILDEYGAETLVDTVVAVKLLPISGGSTDNCDAYEEEVVRQGASFPLIISGFLLSLLLFRRKP